MDRKNSDFGSSIEGGRKNHGPRKKGVKALFNTSKAEEYLRSLDEKGEESSSQEEEMLTQQAQRLAVVLLAWLCYQDRENSDGYRPGEELQELEALCQACYKKEAVLIGLLNGLVDRFSPGVGKAGVVSFLKWLEGRKMLLPSSDKNAPLRFLSWKYFPPNSRRIHELQGLFKALEQKVKASLKDEAENFIKEQIERYDAVCLSDARVRRDFEEGKPGYYLGEISSQRVVLPGGVIKYLGGATVLVEIATRPSKHGEIKIVRPISAVGAAREKFEFARTRNLYLIHASIFTQIRIGRIERLPDEESKVVCQVHQFTRRALGLPIVNEGAQATAATTEDPDAGSPSSSVD
jgi:hypothetical protein